MGLLERAKADIEKYSSDTKSGFGVEITVKRPAGNDESIVVNGLYTEPTQDVDSEGNIINSKKTHVAFSEKFFIDAGFNLRNSNGLIDLKNHRVYVKDITTGVEKKYIMAAWFPDYTVGFITCILHDLNE